MIHDTQKTLNSHVNGNNNRPISPFPRFPLNKRKTTPMKKPPLLRIPYTGPLPPPKIIPRSANTTLGALDALTKFITAPPSPSLHPTKYPNSTVLLTGAGISVASGLADYRGTNGTYRLNSTYRPIYHHEFLQSHQARKRYWARSFLGWTNLVKARPNAAHYAIRDLGEMGVVRSVVTQNVDSFHGIAHPGLETVELHGYLRRVVCGSCGGEADRGYFQGELARLNVSIRVLPFDVDSSFCLIETNLRYSLLGKSFWRR